ncbi:hypothetical protein [Emticicia sp. 17c]|uniref:hypothetical protein n=1 Tax=Emticicia sp. 17c TaxID=3127704 RepID=UPI00301E5FF9
MINVGIIDLTGRISYTEMQRAINAFQKQVNLHLFPRYGVEATINHYFLETDAPSGTWFTWIVDEMDTQGLNGYHFIDNIAGSIVGTGAKGYAVGTASGNPFGLVKYSPNWTITCSHEIIEKLVNPYIDRQVKTDVDNDGVVNEDLLMEIADPVQANAYEIDGIMVTNFVWPEYYTDLLPISGRKYDQMGVISKPNELAEGGYFSFKRAGQWWQGFKSLNRVVYKKLSDNQPLTSSEGSYILKVALYTVLGILVILALTKAVKRKKNG